MIKKQPGEIFLYENILYSIGDWIQCIEGSDYAGLNGVITEIRDGEDRETDNAAPDIYCRLQIPKDAELVQKLEARFSGLYGKTVKIAKVPLDRVILSPDELSGIDGVPDCRKQIIPTLCAWATAAPYVKNAACTKNWITTVMNEGGTL